MSSPISSKPWATACDQYGDLSGELVGSPEGLRHLRELIDEALAKGEVAVGQDVRLDFCKIMVQAVHPEEKKTSETARQKLLKFGCLAVIGTIGLLAVAGGIKVVEILLK